MFSHFHEKFLKFTNLGFYDTTSVKRLSLFITNCRRHLNSRSNLFWIALQSNQLADTSNVEHRFNVSLKSMKEDLASNGWILPQLESNMRNQINISNIMFKKDWGDYKMQSSITKLKGGTNIIGELPILLSVRSEKDWNGNKEQILTFCIEEMKKRDTMNIVVLYDGYLFNDVGKDLRKLIVDKKVIEYPVIHPNSKVRGKQIGISMVKNFIKRSMSI